MCRNYSRYKEKKSEASGKETMGIRHFVHSLRCPDQVVTCVTASQGRPQSRSFGVLRYRFSSLSVCCFDPHRILATMSENTDALAPRVRYCLSDLMISPKIFFCRESKTNRFAGRGARCSLRASHQAHGTGRDENYGRRRRGALQNVRRSHNQRDIFPN